MTQNIDRLSKVGYVPEQEDVLRARARTTGIIELSFQLDSHLFKIVDVGGQRSERKKWFHVFEVQYSINSIVALFLWWNSKWIVIDCYHKKGSYGHHFLCCTERVSLFLVLAIL